jgi:hypothetical protein
MKPKEETNFFLEGQKRIMEQRAKRVAELSAIPAGVVEAAPEASKPIFGDTDKITVERYSPVTGETTSRVVDVSRPLQPRIVKPSPLTLDEIKAGLIEAGNQIDNASETFEHDSVSLDKFYSEQTSLRLEIEELKRQLAEKQNRLQQLESAGTPRDIFSAAVVGLERQVAGLAGSLLVTLSEQAAQMVHGISFEELSKDGQRDAQARYRKVLGRFQSNFYLQIGRTHATATGEQIEARANQLLDDIDQLLDKEYFATE